MHRHLASTQATLLRMTVLVLCGGVLVSSKSAPAASSRQDDGNARQTPNVVLFLVDDLGWADLGCYGNKFHETPHIDRLARQGMRFTDAYAACPVCSPTRASLLTGRYPATLKLTDFIPGHWRPWARLVVPEFNQQLPHEEVTFAEVLGQGGYVSGAFGKWHLGARSHYPDTQGFDEFLVTRGRHFFPHVRATPPVEAMDGAYLADVLTARAEQFIAAHRDRPFVLYLSHYAVHIPLEAKSTLVEKYENKPKPAAGVNHPVYAAMVEHVDGSLGRIVEMLEKHALSDNTIVILFSDNGGLRRRFDGAGPVVTSNAPLRDEKGSLYEGGIRVPLIVRWPGVVEPGTLSHAPVSSVDIFPTMLEAAGLGEQIGESVDGESLLPLLAGSGRLDREAIFWHYPHYHHTAPAGAVRHGDFKLIEFFEHSRLELYNLKEDIGERHNLAEKMPAKTAQLRTTLADWRESVRAKMPQPNLQYDPTKEHVWGKRKREPPPAKAR